MHRHHSTAPTASAGLIMSLASELPKSSPLYRQAQRTANRIQRPHDRQWDHRAAKVICAPYHRHRLRRRRGLLNRGRDRPGV